VIGFVGGAARRLKGIGHAVALPQVVDAGVEHRAGHVHLDVGAFEGLVEADLERLGPATPLEDEGDDPHGHDHG
jgi:hypothetical protein